ncbi:hypothetical protein AK812_SmicGene42097, partial [Symbiodinium microadriaticum]
VAAKLQSAPAGSLEDQKRLAQLFDPPMLIFFVTRVSGSTGRQPLLSQDPFTLQPRVWPEDAPEHGFAEPEDEANEVPTASELAQRLHQICLSESPAAARGPDIRSCFLSGGSREIFREYRGAPASLCSDHGPASLPGEVEVCGWTQTAKARKFNRWRAQLRKLKARPERPRSVSRGG